MEGTRGKQKRGKREKASQEERERGDKERESGGEREVDRERKERMSQFLMCSSATNEKHMCSAVRSILQ